MLIDRMLENAAASIEPGRDFGDMLGHALRGIWSVMEATAEDQQVLSELTQYALRNPGLEDLATWQYGRYYETACYLVQAIADQSAAAAGVARRTP